MFELLFLAITTIILLRSAILVGAGRTPECIVSSMAAIIYLFCLWVAAHLQDGGLVTSKLARVNFLPAPDQAEIDHLSLNWAIELCLILTAEMLSVGLMKAALGQRAAKPGARSSSLVGPHGGDASSLVVRTVVVLLSIGFVANLIFADPGVESRGKGGDGIQVLLKSFLVVGLCLLCFAKLYKKTVFLVILIVGVVFLFLSNVRSPLVLVFFGYVSGLIARNEIKLKSFLSFVLIGLLLAFSAALMSNVRGAIIRGYNQDFQTIASGAIENPFVSIYESGLDTLDGYRLSMAVAPNEPARPLDLLTVFTTFVPRSIWPNKPVDLSIYVSQKYLHYGAGGQFLSPVGYLTISFGGYAYGLMALVVFSGLMASIIFICRRSFYMAIGVCVVFRFFIGGGAFDIYYGLTIVISYLFSSYIASMSLRLPTVSRHLQRR